MATVQPSPGFLDRLRETAGPGGWVEAGCGSSYLVEPRDLLKGRAALVLRPDTPDMTSRIIALCAKARVGVVPYAGGTGLVGGQIATETPDPVILSVERMQRVREVSPEEGAITVEAGCTLSEARSAAHAHGCILPLRIASEGTCRIGGNLATNAGGVQVLRYGNARDLCLGLEAVLADGRIWNGLGTLRKDNTGYDLRHLLIGSEGTLGVITAAVLRLYPVPAEEATAFVAVPDPAAAAALSRRLQKALGEVLSTAELIDQTGVEFVRMHFPTIDTPLGGDHAWYVLAEAEGGEGSRVRERMEKILAEALHEGQIQDAVFAENLAQRDAIRALRETIPLANRQVGAIATHDVSVPLTRVVELILAVRKAVDEIDCRLRTNMFGHLGDGNIHANVFPPEGANRNEFRMMQPLISQSVFKAVRRLGGSVSAEHGVGRLRKRVAIQEGLPVRRDAMKAIKRALDPHGILNPGAMFDDVYGEQR